MKNLFLALALTGFVGAASINTVSAFASAKMTVGGGEECKKDKKCKKGSACCKAKTTATASTEKKSCSSTNAGRKCCSHSKTTASATPATTDAKPVTKPAEEVK